MSNQSVSYSSSSYSYSSSTSNENGQVTGHTSTRTSHTNPDGTTVHHSSQVHGQPQISETRYYDPQGRQTIGDGGDDRVKNQHKIEDVTDEEKRENDRLYEERMEDEYAKREGGA